MVFFNYATMQMAAKIVYYGPGLCGKTTNLHHIYGKTAPSSRGEMISLETETDRTLFFDLLPIDVGVIGGFKTRLQLYTVPGQVFYNTTRKLVLRGVDGIVFVADSQKAMKDANVESFRNMETNLQEIGMSYKDVPLVFQFNKRDLAAILPVDELRESLDPRSEHGYLEAAALRGEGVFETLKEISKLTLRSLKRKMGGAEEKPPVRRPAPAAPPPPAAEEERVSLSDLRADAEAAASALAEQMDDAGFLESGTAGVPEAVEYETASDTDADVEFIGEPEEEAVEAPDEIEEAREAGARESEESPAEAAVEETVQVEFEQEAEARPVDAVKHVKVRSNVDILSELEKLRKNATLTPRSDSRRRKRSTSESLSIDDLLSAGLNHRKEVRRLFEIVMDRKELSRASRLALTVRLGDSENQAVGEEKSYEIELSDMKDVEKVLVALKLHLTGK